MNLTKASYCSESFCWRMLSYSALTCSTLSAHILSAIIIICFSVKMGLVLSALLLLEPAAAIIAPWSMSIIGSGELGADPGEAGSWWAPGDPGELGPTNCLLRFSRLISSLRLLAICSGVRGVSLNTEGGGWTLFSGVQWGLWCMGAHLLLFWGRVGEWRGSKSKLLLRVTHAILLH